MQTIQKFSDIKEKMQTLDNAGKESMVIDFINHLLHKLIGEGFFLIRKVLFSMGIDSMLLIQFKILLEKHLECKIPSEVFYTHDTIEKLSQYVVSTTSTH